MENEQKPTLLERYGITATQLTELIDANGSLRGMLEGYIAEIKLRDIWFSGGQFSGHHKHADHDRKNKGDLVVTYKGRNFKIECKSLQTNSIKTTANGYVAKTQVDGSDRREVRMPDGNMIQTTNLVVGEFDLLAVSLFKLNNEWAFLFAKNTDLPRSTYRGYPPEYRQHLLKTLVNISWPPSSQDIFRPEPFTLLDELCEKDDAMPVAIIEEEHSVADASSQLDIQIV